MTAEPLISTRTRGADARHLALMHQDPVKGLYRALCKAQQQENCGAGTFRSLLKWPTCRTCKNTAAEMGPHPSQSGERDPGVARRIEELLGRCH